MCHSFTKKLRNQYMYYTVWLFWNFSPTAKCSRNMKLRPTVWNYKKLIATCQFYVKSILPNFESQNLPFFTICLPLRFYVKPNFGELKMLFFAHLEVLKFDFNKFELLIKSEIDQNWKLRVSEIAKMAIFEIQNLPKLISSK